MSNENGRLKEIMVARNMLQNHPVDISKSVDSFVRFLNAGELDKMVFSIVDIEFFLTNIAFIYGITDTVENELDKLMESASSH